MLKLLKKAFYIFVPDAKEEKLNTLKAQRVLAASHRKWWRFLEEKVKRDPRWVLGCNNLFLSREQKLMLNSFFVIAVTEAIRQGALRAAS